MATFAVIMPAAGQSSRFKDPSYKKPFAPLAGRAVWLHAAERFLQRDDVKQVIVVISADDREYFQMKFGANMAIMGIEAVNGGATRSASVQAGLARVKPDVDFVAVHDAARPVLADKWVDQVFDTARKTGAAILATPVTGTLKRVDGAKIIADTVDRTNLWEAQTPQVFKRQLLLDAHAGADSDSATDDAELVQRLGVPVSIVLGSALNLKITTKEDLVMAGHALKSLPKPKLGGGNPFADGDMWR
jgi:2-C-methyl-D-erythritol 4-phosphate cytidylyltransferase